ncbi:hypothetical protein THAOC_08539 [Thalassiosira oceanica]|uniref:Methyltransferase type 11 domain-containing protein n=1 Tax=Thalassiosira oceanica TaxID=159749 RepID=K0SXI7_THAOC|nr:hypothetical protein THAOC_08539 [Thalassiosira oceanica]|eukprot:EJK70125.1 hypothetical protein THAOC_08539 [Thalassiosira oceanica]
MAPSRGVYQAIHDEYRDMATWYDSFWASYTDPVLRRPAEEVVRIIRRRPPPREPPAAAVTVLDVGAGTGALLRRLRDETSDLGGLVALVGAEPSGEMLEQARRKHTVPLILTCSSSNSPDQPPEDLPFADESTDIVVSTSAFHFFVDKVDALREMRRVLKREGGSLVITDWCNDYLLVKLYHLLERIRWNFALGYSEAYPGPVTSEEMAKLVRDAGFDNVRIATYRVRVFGFFFWGTHTVTATKP